MRICAPSATRTRDLLLRRSFRATPPPATVQVRPRVVGLSVLLNDRRDRHVLARIWHGRLSMRPCTHQMARVDARWSLHALLSIIEVEISPKRCQSSLAWDVAEGRELDNVNLKYLPLLKRYAAITGSRRTLHLLPCSLNKPGVACYLA
jgi:hypothetical protein